MYAYLIMILSTISLLIHHFSLGLIIIAELNNDNNNWMKENEILEEKFEI